jgi:pyruvate formate lyase activating enzyme
MEKNKALIVDIKRNSLDDGPGIRTLIFFKGCPLKCIWCHNPETKYPKQEIFFDYKLCIGCKECLKVCEEKAIEFEKRERINRSKCKNCFKCVEVCPSGSLKIAGKSVTVEEIFEEIMKDEIFYRYSSGGVTFSGGEPTLYIEFISEVCKKLKEVKIHTNIETNGMFDYKKFENLLLPYLDLIFFDIKFIDKNLHKKYTGCENEIILENFSKLCLNPNTPVLPRVPLIPDITNTEENLKDIANFLKKNSVKKLQILPYNPLWLDKAIGIGQKILYERGKSMSKEEIEKAKNIFLEFSFEVL